MPVKSRFWGRSEAVQGEHCPVSNVAQKQFVVDLEPGHTYDSAPHSVGTPEIKELPSRFRQGLCRLGRFGYPIVMSYGLGRLRREL